MAHYVLTDASPLIGLALVGGVEWLRELFGKVGVTPEVLQELRAAGSLETNISQALAGEWLHPYEAAPGIPASPKQPRPPHLGAGEWATLQAAANYPGPCLLLLDDRLARREAQSLGLAYTGTAALVGLAQQQGLTPSARDVFARLLRADFRLSSEVIRSVLEKVRDQ